MLSLFSFGFVLQGVCVIGENLSVIFGLGFIRSGGGSGDGG